MGRLNKKPIFILGFTRGGTNILLNMLLSHPNVCGAGGELHEVFRRHTDDKLPQILRKLARYLPIWIAQAGDVFSPNNWQPRGPFRSYTKQHVDKVLYEGKIRARKPGQNKYKAENQLYTDNEIRAARLVSKVVDGNVLLSGSLADTFPDATFIGLVRNGFAVCEGHIRRGARLEDVASAYEIGCQKMIGDSQKMANYHLFRYEDCVNEPNKVLNNVFVHTELDRGKVDKIRLETKKVVGTDGSYEYVRDAAKKELLWYTPEDMPTHFRTDANANQIARLTPDQVVSIRNICNGSLNYFGYE